MFDSSIKDYKSYQGNKLLKRSGVKIEWSPEMVEEWTRCSEDPIYFIEKYIKVIHVDRGLVPLHLYDYQKEIVMTVDKNRYTIICTSRQAGKTTAIVGFAIWYALFNTEKWVAILANKGSTAREILNRIQIAYQNLPSWIQSGVKEWNKGSIDFENGSRIVADSTASDAIRGWSFSVVIVDEAAHIDNWPEFSLSVLPTISSGDTTKLILISTPYGLNHFHETWENAKSGKNEYAFIEVPWQRVPGRGEDWKKKTLAMLNFDITKFAQEYENEFQGSSGTLIAGWKLKELGRCFEVPIKEVDFLRMYREPIRGHRYVMTADVSEGKGLDYSTFHVVDVTTMPYVQAAVFRSNVITPNDFAGVMHRTAKFYYDPTVLIEYESLGPQVAETLYNDLEYENLLFTGSAGNMGKKITSKGGVGVDKGIKMSRTVKGTGCSMLKLLIEQNQLLLVDHATYGELSTFSRKENGSYEAEDGKHDDLVMSLVVFAWLSNQTYFKEFTDINTLARLRDKTDEDIENEMMPFGFVFDGGMEDENEPIKTVPSMDAWMAD